MNCTGKVLYNVGRKEGSIGTGGTGLNRIRKILKSMAVAFSLYSIIPMPRWKWESEDMEDQLIFFPLVGAVIGLLQWIWIWIVRKAGIGVPAYAAVAVAIPLLVTGGFHLDGYLDTMDGIHSWKSREEKLRIMSDPHVGAFAVVWGGIWFLLFYAGTSALKPGRVSAAWCLSFVLSRAFSGLGVVTIPAAKKEGMLQTFAGTAQKKRVQTALVAELCVCACLMGFPGGIAGLVTAAAGAAVFLWYRSWSVRKFGGITGDLAGFFLCICELAMTITAALFS